MSSCLLIFFFPELSNFILRRCFIKYINRKTLQTLPLLRHFLSSLLFFIFISGISTVRKHHLSYGMCTSTRPEKSIKCNSDKCYDLWKYFVSIFFLFFLKKTLKIYENFFCTELRIRVRVYGKFTEFKAVCYLPYRMKFFVFLFSLKYLNERIACHFFSVIPAVVGAVYYNFNEI